MATKRFISPSHRQQLHTLSSLPTLYFPARLPPQRFVYLGNPRHSCRVPHLWQGCGFPKSPSTSVCTQTSSLRLVLLVRAAALPEATPCGQRCFFSGSSSQLLNKVSPGNYTEEPIHLLMSVGVGAISHAHTSVTHFSDPVMPLSTHPQTEELPQGQKNKKVLSFK